MVDITTSISLDGAKIGELSKEALVSRAEIVKGRIAYLATQTQQARDAIEAARVAMEDARKNYETVRKANEPLLRKEESRALHRELKLTVDAARTKGN